MCEIALAHAVSDKTEAAYRRGDMMEKPPAADERLGEFCQREPLRQQTTSSRFGREAQSRSGRIGLT